MIGLSIPVEDFHDFHAVDVLHDGVVHFLPGGVVVPHLAHAGAVHHAHGQHAQREGAEGKQTQLPVREEHGRKYHHRHRQIGQPFRQGVGQQQFHALDVVNEHLLPDSNALLLDRAQGLLFQLALEMEPEVFQSMIGGAMRQSQPLHIEKAVEDHAQSHGPGVEQGFLQCETAPSQQGPQQAVEEEIGQHAHGHAGHQYQNGGISRLPVASGVAQDFLKHSITPFD